MNTDGTGWTQIQRTTGPPSKWRPELQIVGGKIYRTWWQGSSSWTAQAIWTGETGSNILSTAASYGLGMDENGRVSGFLNNDWTDTRYRATSGTSPGAQVFAMVDTTEWTHVAMTYDRSFLKLYVNGELTETRALDDSIPVNTFDLMIGDDFRGILDEVMISNRALTDSEIVEHYHEGIAQVSFVPDFRLYKCDEEDTLWIQVDEKVEDLEATFLEITYDGSFITPTDVIKGPALDPPGNFFLYYDIHPDSILISLAVLSGSFDGPGSILGLIFTTDNEVASTQLSIDSSSLRNSDNLGIVHYTTGADIQIDCTLPTVEVVSPPSGHIYTSLPTLTIDFADNRELDRGYYQIDDCEGTWLELWSYDSDASDTTIDWTIPSVPEGPHTIYFKVGDDAGNTNDDTCTYFWSFDYGIATISLLPSFQLDKCTDVDTLWIYAGDYVVDVKAAFFEIGYDASFITPTEVIKGPALDPPGNYVLYPYIYPDSIVINLAVLVGHFDGPGSLIGIILTADNEVASTPLSFDSSTVRDSLNHDIPHETTGADIQIDCTIPTVVVTSPASGNTLNYLPNLTIHFQDDLGLDQGYYQIDNCTGTWSEFWPHNCTVSDTTIEWTVPSVSEGSHDIYFKATDDAGNSNGDTCSYFWSFTYDTTPPPPPTLISPPDSTVTNDNTPTFIWSSTAGSGGSYTLQYATDSLFTSVVTVSGLQDTTYEVSTPLPDDDYYWHVKATDRANNESGYQSRPFMFTIDAAVPNVPVLLTPADSSFTCDSIPTFTWTSSSLIFAGGSGTEGGTGGLGSQLTPVTYTLQYGSDPSFTEVTTVEGIVENMYTVPDTTALDDTTYYWQVEAVDAADNHSGYQEHPFQFTVFVAGDANGDGTIDIGDVVYLINYLFREGPAPDPLQAGNVNDDEVIDIGDVVYLINYLFREGPPPECGS
jgi:hypothetical protein